MLRHYKHTIGWYVEDEAYCADCATTFDDVSEDDPGVHPIQFDHEFDYPVFCNECHDLIDVSLTSEGIAYTRELLLTSDEDTLYTDQLMEWFRHIDWSAVLWQRFRRLRDVDVPAAWAAYTRWADASDRVPCMSYETLYYRHRQLTLI